MQTCPKQKSHFEKNQCKVLQASRKFCLLVHLLCRNSRVMNGYARCSCAYSLKYTTKEANFNSGQILVFKKSFAPFAKLSETVQIKLLQIIQIRNENRVSI